MGIRTGFELATAVASDTWQPEWASPWESDHMATHLLEDLFGLAAGMTVTRNKAMSLDVISKGHRIFVGQICRLSLRTMKGSRPAPVQPLLLAQPEADKTLASSLAWLVGQLYFYPRAWWTVEARDFYGWPRTVKRLEREDTKLDAKGKLVEAYGRPVNPRDIIEFEGITGGLLTVAADLIRRGIVINRAAALAEDNPVPALDLHNNGEDLDPDEIRDLLDSWQRARQTRGVGYSSKSLEVKPLGAPVEALLLDGRRAIDLGLARHVGLPAWALDVPVEGTSLTYNNRASRNWDLIDLGLSPLMTAITSRLSMPDLTPRGWTVEFDTDALTRPDLKTRFETYRIGLGNEAFITREQVATWEGWEGTTAS